MARYLITGGSGFLGINLVRYLLARGHDVHTLDIQPFDYPEQSQVTHHLVDVTDPDALNTAFNTSKPDIVVHAAAALPKYSAEQIFLTDVAGTENVLFISRLLGVKRVIHISSTAVYGLFKDWKIPEDYPFSGVGPYGEAKIQAENYCRKYRDQGMIVPIIRPKSFIGPERLGVFALLYDFAYSRHGFPVLGDGLNHYQLLDVEDLCSAILLVAEGDQDVVNTEFNIGVAPESLVTVAEDYQSVLDLAGFGKKVRRFPGLPAVMALTVLDSLGLSPLYPWVYKSILKNSAVDISKARNLLGWEPQFTNIESLRRNYIWYRDNQDSFAGKSGNTHRVPWSQGALRLIKAVM